MPTDTEQTLEQFVDIVQRRLLTLAEQGWMDKRATNNALDPAEDSRWMLLP